MKINSGWGETKDFAKEDLKLLSLIGWDKYLEKARKPYPVSLIGTKKNIKANQNYKKGKPCQIKNPQ